MDLELKRAEMVAARQVEESNQQKIEKEQLETSLLKLENSTFINEVFQIQTPQSNYASISGFRLAKDINIAWEETNAALGQVAYLITVLAQRFKYKFTKHSLTVRACFSSIHLKGGQKTVEFPLYYDETQGDFQLFNDGLAYLVECFVLVRSHIARIKRLQISNRTDIVFKYSLTDEKKWNTNAAALLTELHRLSLLKQEAK